MKKTHRYVETAYCCLGCQKSYGFDKDGKYTREWRGSRYSTWCEGCKGLFQQAPSTALGQSYFKKDGVVYWGCYPAGHHDQSTGEQTIESK